MTHRHDEKGDETVALRVPEKIAAALTAEALWKNETRSELMRRILEDRYANGNSANISQDKPTFANNSAEEILKQFESLKTAIDAAFGKIGMVHAGSTKHRRSA